MHGREGSMFLSKEDVVAILGLVREPGAASRLAVVAELRLRRFAVYSGTLVYSHYSRGSSTSSAGLLSPADIMPSGVAKNQSRRI